MSINKTHMKTIIRRNGHLRLEGDESADELRMALINLRKHTHLQCYRPEMGTPIEALIPDISALLVKSTRTRNVTSVGIKHERL